MQIDTTIHGLQLNLGGDGDPYLRLQHTDAPGDETKFAAVLGFNFGPHNRKPEDARVSVGATYQPDTYDATNMAGLGPFEPRFSAGLALNLQTGQVAPSLMFGVENLSVPGFGLDIVVTMNGVEFVSYDFDVANENHEIGLSPSWVNFTGLTNTEFVKALVPLTSRRESIETLAIAPPPASMQQNSQANEPFTVKYISSTGATNHVTLPIQTATPQNETEATTPNSVISQSAADLLI